MATIPLEDIAASPLNPRKSFPQAEIDELAASIAEVGILEPLIVRPTGPKADHNGTAWTGVEKWEVICGERRLRASRKAKLPGAPCLIRPMNDHAAKAIMLVENIQRKDLKPSEEAVAYRELVNTAGVEEVAKQLGRPVSAVREILRLALLPKWCLEAVDNGTLARSAAAVVARVPGEKAREMAAAEALTEFVPNNVKDLGKYVAEQLKQGRGPMSTRDVKEMVRRDYSRELKGAPFDRKSLSLVPQAGSCDECPKRAGNMPDLVAEGIREDVCTDTDCFAAKVAAGLAEAKNRAAERGLIVIDPPATSAGWTPIDAKVEQWNSDPLLRELQESHQGKKLRTILGKAPVKVYFTISNDQPRELVKTAEARKALIEAKVLTKAKDSKTAKGRGEKYIGDWTIKARLNVLVARKVRTKAAGESNVKGPLLLACRCMVRSALDSTNDSTEDLVRDFAPDAVSDEYGVNFALLDETLKTFSASDLAGILASLLSLEAADSYGDLNKFAAEFNAYAGVDEAAMKALRKQAETELKAEAKKGRAA